MFSPDKVTHRTFGITLLDDEKELKFKWRIFHVFPLAKINEPSIFAHQFPSNPAFEIYTPMTNPPKDITKKQEEVLIANMEAKAFKIIESLGGESKPEDVLHYDLWKYFYQIGIDDFKGGYFDKLEAMQGQNNTFYNMGLNSFELIEPIARYSKHLVDTYFLGAKK